jgi:hypothetical protein
VAESCRGAALPQVADLLFVLTRSTVNYSLIAYQARRKASGPAGLDPKRPVDAYWLDIDFDKLPSGRGKQSDKVDIDVFGRRAYAADCGTPDPADAGCLCRVTLRAFKQRPWALVCVDGQHRLRGQIDGLEADLEKVYYMEQAVYMIYNPYMR